MTRNKRHPSALFVQEVDECQAEARRAAGHNRPDVSERISKHF